MTIHWFPEMDEALRKMWCGPHSVQQVADKIGVGKNTCWKRANELGLSRRGRKPVRRLNDHPIIPRHMRVAEMLANGMEPKRDWKAMGFTSRASANASLQRIRIMLGWQAK